MADPIEALENSSDFLDVNGFPDDIILLIFKKLPFLDLYRCSQVCHRWFDLSLSVHLKEIVIEEYLKFGQLSLLMQDHFPQHLETFELLNDYSDRLTCVESCDLRKLRAKSPSITKLSLRRCDLRSVCMGDLPKTIRCLSIRGSEIQPRDFFSVSGDERDRPQLTCLEAAVVRNCVYVSILLKPLKSLRCLYLSNCPTINDDFILSITEVLPRLKILDVEGTGISNEGLQVILTHCIDVEELYIGCICIYHIENLEIFTQISKLSILCIRNTLFADGFVELLNQSLGNRVKLVKPFDPPVNGSGESLEFIGAFVICDHYLSHAC